LSVVSRALSALCVYLRFGHHSHPVGNRVPNFVSVVTSIAELARGEKLRTESLDHSLNHPAYLMPREPKLSLRNMLVENYTVTSTTSL